MEVHRSRISCQAIHRLKNDTITYKCWLRHKTILSTAVVTLFENALLVLSNRKIISTESRKIAEFWSGIHRYILLEIVSSIVWSMTSDCIQYSSFVFHDVRWYHCQRCRQWIIWKKMPDREACFELKLTRCITTMSLLHTSRTFVLLSIIHCAF